MWENYRKVTKIQKNTKNAKNIEKLKSTNYTKKCFKQYPSPKKCVNQKLEKNKIE